MKYVYSNQETQSKDSLTYGHRFDSFNELLSLKSFQDFVDLI